MPLVVKYVLKHPSGRVDYRRPFPAKLVPFVAWPSAQFKRSLGREEESGFLSRYEDAHANYAALKAEAEKVQAGAFDTLDAPTVAFLAEAYRSRALGDDEALRWRPPAPRGVQWDTKDRRQWAFANRAAVLAIRQKHKEIRALGDMEGLLATWADRAAIFARECGCLVDPADVEGVLALCRALNDAAIAVADDTLSRDAGHSVPTPPAPTPPEKPDRSPVATTASEPLLEVFDGYAAAQGLSAGVRKEWRGYMAGLIKFLGHDDANRRTREDVVSWRDHLLGTLTRYGKPRKPVTVKDKYITALRCTLGWALEERRLGVNVAADVKVRVPKEQKTRDKDFTMEEARAILRASLIAPTGRLSAPYVRGRRWVPWLCAYSGARVNEITQLRREDIFEVEGVWVMRITPEAGTVKTGEARLVPLHADLIAQGFLAMVMALPDGEIFYDPAGKRVTDETSGLYRKAGERIANWVRKDVGITDPAIKPNHAWRHLFKTLAGDVGIQERVADAIQGHAPTTSGRKYGKVSVHAKALAMKSFPRFDIEADPAIARQGG